MEARFLVFQHISSDNSLVVAANCYLGNIAQGFLIAKLLTLLSRHWAVTANINDLIILYYEYGDFTAVTYRNLAHRLAVKTFIGDYGYLPRGEIP